MEEACKEGNIFVTTTGCTDIVQGRYDLDTCCSKNILVQLDFYAVITCQQYGVSINLMRSWDFSLSVLLDVDKLHLLSYSMEKQKA